MAPMSSLPPGFRFHPTDEELVAYYLERKITGRTIELEIIPEVDLYKCEPWDLPDKSYLPSKDMEWYFYSQRDRKYPNGSRTNRATKAGYWKATGKDRQVQSHKRPVGMKKTLVYYRGRAPHGIRTNWVMHEYRLIQSVCGTGIDIGTASISTLKDSYALCRIFKKALQIPKSKEQQMINGPQDEREPFWVMDKNSIGDDTSGTETSQGREGEAEDENENFDHHQNSKFPYDASSSDLTEGTPVETGVTDDSQTLFASDEANSSTNFSSFNMDFWPSSLIQDIGIPECTSLQQYQLSCPPLVIEDFPQIDTIETSKPESTIDEYIMHDKYRNSMSGTIMLEEIFMLYSPKENSINLQSMQDY